MTIDEAKRHVIITAEDLRDDSITTTVKQISANPEKFYLLEPGNLQLFEAVEKLAANIEDESLLTCVRFANEIHFALHTYLMTGDNTENYREIKTFSELLESLEYDETLKVTRNDYHVVIDDNGITQAAGNTDEASRQTALLFQQTVFLNIDIDIKKKSEIAKSLIKDRFRKVYPELRREAEADKAYIDGLTLSGDSEERAQRMSQALANMLDYFEEARERPIRIAAMGSKKAGKSVVINGLLKRDYAPTSSELPTPNVIRYIPEAEDTPLTLDYKGQRMTFGTPEELSRFIGNEFIEAQKHTGEGSGLEDMIIHYPASDFTNYEVWDTPGPNFAGAGEEHHKIAEDCINKADICIFVMNYSNHLTDDEVNFLKKIHSAFKRNNKFYSLFVAINRIDERYASEVEKSVVRLVDYIRSRLERLDYKNIVLFGTSALQYFYLGKVDELLKHEGLDFSAGSITALKKNYRKFMTQLRFIEASRGNLRDFHGIDNPTPEDLSLYSGMPQLEHYLKYIGEQKVDTEIVDNVISKCETEAASIHNALLIIDMLTMTDEDKKYLVELGRLVEGLTAEVKNAVDKVAASVSGVNMHEAGKVIRADVMSNRDNVMKTAEDRCRRMIEDTSLTEDDIKEMKEGRHSGRMRELLKNAAEVVAGLNRQSAEALDRTAEATGMEYSRTVEARIQATREDISRKTEEVKAKVTNSKASALMQDFRIPEFPAGLSKMVFTAEAFEAGVDDDMLRDAARGAHSTSTRQETKYRTETITKHRTVRREREKRGFWEHLTFWKKRYEDVTEPYTEEIQKPYTVDVSIDVFNVRDFKRIITRELVLRLKDVIVKAHELIGTEAEKVIDAIYSDIQEQCKEINASYMRLFEDFKNDIDTAADTTEKHKQAIEHDISVLREAEKRLEHFFSMWGNIIRGGDK